MHRQYNRANLQNLEIILVNNGSTDGLGKICNDYAKLDRRVIVIHKINEGRNIARCEGIFVVNGEIIAFVGSNDGIEDKMY